MTILVDTNIILDIFLQREPYAGEAREIMTKCAEREVIGYLAAHSIPNLFYILRKNYSRKERRGLIRNLCDIFRISDLNAEKIISAVENEGFADFEDCLQDECARMVNADCLVTCNLKDFKVAKTKVYSPDEFVKLLSLGDQ